MDGKQILYNKTRLKALQPTTNSTQNSASTPLVSTGELTTLQTVTLAAGQDQIHGLVFQSTKLWACTNTSPAKVIRFNNPDTDLSDYDVVTLTARNSGLDILYLSSINKIVVATSGGVVEVDPSTMAFSTVIAPGGGIESMTQDGTNLYIAAGTGVKKYLISDYSLVASLALTGLGKPHCLRYDGTDLYATAFLDPGKIAKIPTSLASFTSVTFATGDGYPTDDLAFTTDYVWVGLETFPAVSYILKIAKSDLSITHFNVGMPSLSYGVYSDGTSIWNLIPTSPSVIQNINPTTTAIVNTTLASGSDGANEIISVGNIYYVTCYLSPAKVLRLSS